MLTRAQFDEATRLNQWPGEQINLKPGDVLFDTLYETLPVQCIGTVTLGLVAKPVGSAAHVQRLVLALKVVRG